jgi:hypothetical protein
VYLAVRHGDFEVASRVGNQLQNAQRIAVDQQQIGTRLRGKLGINGYVAPRTRLLSALLVGRFAEPS